MEVALPQKKRVANTSHAVHSSEPSETWPLSIAIAGGLYLKHAPRTSILRIVSSPLENGWQMRSVLEEM